MPCSSTNIGLTACLVACRTHVLVAVTIMGKLASCLTSYRSYLSFWVCCTGLFRTLGYSKDQAYFVGCSTNVLVIRPSWLSGPCVGCPIAAVYLSFQVCYTGLLLTLGHIQDQAYLVDCSKNVIVNAIIMAELTLCWAFCCSCVT